MDRGISALKRPPPPSSPDAATSPSRYTLAQGGWGERGKGVVWHSDIGVPKKQKEILEIEMRRKMKLVTMGVSVMIFWIRGSEGGWTEVPLSLSTLPHHFHTACS